MKEKDIVKKQDTIRKIGDMEMIYREPTTNYSAWSRIVISNFKEQVALVLQDDQGNISEPFLIGRDEATSKSCKAITKCMKNCIGGMGEIHNINNVAKALRMKYGKLPKVTIGDEGTSMRAYFEFFDKAIKADGNSEIYIDEKGNCNILAMKFTEISEQLCIDINRKRFLDTMKTYGLLIHNVNRNDLKATPIGNQEQCRMICLKPMGEYTEAQKSKQDTQDYICEEVVEEGDAFKSAGVFFDKTVAFPYMGGKNSKMGDLIREIMPDQIIDYYELFGGSGAVLLNTNSIYGTKQYNDLDYGVATFFSVMADATKSEKLIKRLAESEYSQKEFDSALEIFKRGYKNSTDNEVAYAEYILITQSFNNMRENFAKDKVTTEIYQKRITTQLPKVVERLKDVKVTNNNALEEIKRIKNQKEATVFLDPPYDLKLLSSNKLYRCILSEADQIQLLTLIQDAKCKIFICGYRDPSGNGLYDKYLNEEYGWKYICIGEFHKASSSRKKSIGTEWVWYNTDLSQNAKYYLDVDCKEVR